MKINANQNTTININGKSFTRSVQIINGKIITNDNREIEIDDPIINITVTGDVDYIETTSGDIVVHGNASTVSNVSGDITVKSSIGNASTVSGDIQANKIDNASTVSGDIIN